MTVSYPLRVTLIKKAETPEGYCQYFYQLYDPVDGEKVGAGITIPVKKGDSMPDFKSCVLSTLELREIVKLVSSKEQ